MWGTIIMWRVQYRVQCTPSVTHQQIHCRPPSSTTCELITHNPIFGNFGNLPGRLTFAEASTVIFALLDKTFSKLPYFLYSFLPVIYLLIEPTIAITHCPRTWVTWHSIERTKRPIFIPCFLHLDIYVYIPLLFRTNKIVLFPRSEVCLEPLKPWFIYSLFQRRKGTIRYYFSRVL